jgi:hypothetical protein
VVGDEEGLRGFVGDDAFLALGCVVLALHFASQCFMCGFACVARTFFALRESSVDSMVMYFWPLTLTPFAMTALGSLLSEKDAAIALISAAVSWRVSVPGRIAVSQGTA